MTLELRKLVCHTEEIFITNPWASRGFVEDLTPTILDLAP